MSWVRIEAPKAGIPFNFSRKAYHMLGLLVPLAVYFRVFDGAAGAQSIPHYSRFVCLAILVSSLLLLLALDTLRFAWPPLNALFQKYLGVLLKEEESERYNATIPYFTACIILLLFFSDVAATLACIFLMIGDPFAAFVGMRFGRIRFSNGKSLEGLVAFLVFGLAGALLFLSLHSSISAGGPFSLQLPDGAWNAALLAPLLGGVLAAALAEFFSVVSARGILDDNLVVPLFGAAGMCLFAYQLTPELFEPMLLGRGVLRAWAGALF
ncbi:MAG: dolichol kinase [Leptospirales bacterium]|nr:dolichol kinase [Leptospirales bacterium]